MCCSHWWRDLWKGIEDFFFFFLNKWEGVGGREEIYGTFKLFTQGAVE